MNELRKDYLLNRYVIVSSNRGKRPDFSKKNEYHSDKASCPFCQLQVSPSFEWKADGKTVVSVIPNKFSAVSLEGNPTLTTHNTFYTFASAYGVSEVVIETPEHDVDFEDLPEPHVTAILSTFKERIKTLSAIPHIKYVSVFKNRGRDAGASIPHAHSQVIAHNMLPPWINEELMTHYQFVIENGFCPYCDIIKREKDSERRIFENEEFVAFTPYASRFAYEAWIFPKNHVKSIADLDQASLTHLANILKRVVQRLDALGKPAYNIEFHNAELTGENFHFHVEILPRIATWAGFELETGTIINTVSPEDAARFYRGEQ
jgi:UDPglucose--hexose-1-phosphate uridylyltransferase